MNSQLSIYSAFLSENSTVKIISAVDLDLWSSKSQLECLFMVSENTSVKHSSNAYLKILLGAESKTNNFAATLIQCRLHSKYEQNEVFVKIKFTINSLSTESPILKVQKPGINNLDTVICIRPLFGPYSSLSAVIEFFAYYRANGIYRFVFYDFDIGENVKNFINSFEFNQIIPFKLSFPPLKIHAMGQIAALNDCLLRFSNSPIIFVDIDEFIMIRGPNKTSIQSLINENMNDRRISNLVINNRFFCRQFQTDNRFPRILHQNKLQKSYWQPGKRSKLIILRPNTVVDIWIHKVYVTTNGFYSKELSDSEILLYHYRSCCDISQELVHLEHHQLYFKSFRDEFIEDNQMLKFKLEINEFIDKYVEKFSGSY
jgi:hypothetical protein